MKYAQIQQLAKALKNQGVIAKKFNLSQKAEILIAEIQKNITKVDRTNISKELAAILLDFTSLAINYKPEATKTPQKTTKKAAKSTKETGAKKQEMTQKEFNAKFIPFYKKIKLEEEVKEGIPTTRFLKLQRLFTEKYLISNATFDKYVRNIKGVFVIWENDKELIQRN